MDINLCELWHLAAEDGRVEAVEVSCVVTLLAALGSEKSINKAEKIKETVINAKIQLCNAITENAAMLNGT